MKVLKSQKYEARQSISSRQTNESSHSSIRQRNGVNNSEYIAIPQFEYQLTRVSKRRHNIIKKILWCDWDDEDEVAPITNKELSSNNKINKPNDNSNIKSIGLYGRKKFEEVREEIKENSEFGHLEKWDMISVIVKSGESIQQEKFASNLMQYFQEIFETHKVKCWLRPFNIVATSPIGGIVETITNAISIDRLKKSFPEMDCLRTYYLKTFGGSVKSKIFK